MTIPTVINLLAQDDSTLFLGEDFFPWMILALGAAMVVGNLLALVRPPAGRNRSGGAEDGARGKAGDEEVERPPLAGSLVFIALGLAAALWGLASLLS